MLLYKSALKTEVKFKETCKVKKLIRKIPERDIAAFFAIDEAII
jgi:hypothetical protein